jgi:hypothetical protein
MIFESRVAVATKFCLAVLFTHMVEMITSAKSKSFWLEDTLHGTEGE